MTIQQRRLFMFFFIFVFFVITPVVIFMAKGYRFDTKNGIFIYSGSITIKSIPRKIDVSLNGKKQDEKKINYINNSYTINGVRPGKYLLKCEKDGYTSWEKNIEVHSGISTEFWNILLFPKEENQKSTIHTNKKISQFFLSPRNDQEIIFFSEEDDKRMIYLLDSKTNEIEKIFETDELYFLDSAEKENVEWSSDNKSILIPLKDNAGQKNYIIAKIKKEEITDPVNIKSIFKKIKENKTDELEKSKTTEIKKRLKSDDDENLQEEVLFKKIRWMFDKNNELVILTQDHELYYLNTENSEKTILIDKEVSGFDFAGNRIYYTQLPNNLVWEIRDNNIETKRQITTQAFAQSEDSFTELTVYDEYRIAIKNKENGNLFIFNEEKEEGETLTKTIDSEIQGIQFSNDGKKLLYWSNSEIWFLMLRDWDVQPVRKKGDYSLITRFSTPIRNVQWLDNYENIIFSVENKIKSTSVDMRDHVNIIDILEASENFENRDFFYNKKNKTLFINSFGKNESNKTLKSIPLIESSGIFGFGE